MSAGDPRDGEPLTEKHMALNFSFNVANFLLDLEGEMAGHLASAEIGSIKAEEILMPVASDYITKKSIGNAEYGSCQITTGMSECQQQLDWIAAIWRKDVIEKSGAIILADMNFKERRRATFTGGCVEEVKYDDLDANGGGKKPYQMTYKFAPETLKYESGTGAQIKGNLGQKQKALSAQNFRIKIGGLPCERITKVTGLQVTSEVAKEYHGSFRFPTRHQANVKYGDMTVEISGDEKTFTEWNKFATMTLQDGVCTETEELTTVIEWLDQSLKKTLMTLTLRGCGLKEFKFGPKFEHAKSGMATCTAVFNVETIDPGPNGIDLKWK
jgi:hypothetical protein